MTPRPLMGATQRVSHTSIIRHFVFGIALLAASSSGVGAANSVSGLIYAAGKTPLADVRVRLLEANSQTLIDDTVSNAAGKFTFTDVPQGQYRIELQRTGYFNAETLLAGGRGVEVNNNLSAAPQIFFMAPNGSISGIVSTEGGVALKNIRVDLRRPGEKETAISGITTVTDDRGEFHFADVAPGYYSVVAVYRASEHGGSTTFVRLPFPEPTTSSEPAYFALRPGQHYNQISITVRQSETHAVTGNVTGIPANWEGKHLAVAVIPARGARIPVAMASTDTAGVFTFHVIPDGDYQLVAWGPITGFGAAGPTSGAETLEGQTQLTVSAADISGLEVALGEGATISASVNPLPNDPLAKACLDRASLTLQPAEVTLPQQTLTAPIRPDGIVAFTKVALGSYQVSLRGPSRNCFITANSSGSREVEIVADVRIQVSVGALATHVSGIVVDAGHTAVAGAWVLATPLEATKRSILFQTDIIATLSDASGHYSFDALRPGPYKLLALMRLDPIEWSNPTLWAQGVMQQIVSGRQNEGKLELVAQGDQQ